jgi:integrase
MGRGRRGTGVEVRPGNIRISFTWQEKRCRETLERAPTPPNIKHAERLVEEINRRIALGNFVYGEFFPHSARALVAPRPQGTLREVGALWLKTKGRLAPATLSQYANALEFWYAQLGADRRVADLSHGELAGVIGDYDWPSFKLCNNYLIALRGLLWLAKKDRHITDDPMEGIENMASVKKLPDPLSADEAEKILADIAQHYDEQVFNYFDFAFQTGMRPEELIALRWSDIDWNRSTARVERARTFRGALKDVKNHEERDVDLSPRALAALTRQKKHTLVGSAAKEEDDIFQNPVTRKPWHDERSQRDHYWQPALARAGVRRRRAYATRHTYATRLIMGGLKPAYVAHQMGHTLQVLFSTYARWLNDADKGAEASKLGEVLGSSIANRKKA